MDALRLGDLELFKEIEAESGTWWFPMLDRGAGAALHFAAHHGQVLFSVLTGLTSPTLQEPLLCGEPSLLFRGKAKILK